MIWYFLECLSLRYPGVSKNKKGLDLGVMDPSEKPEIMRMRVFEFSNNEIEKLLVRNEAE